MQDTSLHKMQDTSLHMMQDTSLYMMQATRRFFLHLIDVLSEVLCDTYIGNKYTHCRGTIWCCEFESWSGQGVQHYVINLSVTCDRGRWFSPGPPVSSTNKTDRHDLTEILLKVVLSTMKPNHSLRYKHVLWQDKPPNITHVHIAFCDKFIIVSTIFLLNCNIFCRFMFSSANKDRNV